MAKFGMDESLDLEWLEDQALVDRLEDRAIVEQLEKYAIVEPRALGCKSSRPAHVRES